MNLTNDEIIKMIIECSKGYAFDKIYPPQSYMCLKIELMGKLAREIWRIVTGRTVIMKKYYRLLCELGTVTMTAYYFQSKEKVSECWDKVIVERNRQDEIWGEQHHNIERWNTILLEEVGEAASEINGSEVSENYYTELIHCLAVIVATLQDVISRDTHFEFDSKVVESEEA